MTPQALSNASAIVNGFRPFVDRSWVSQPEPSFCFTSHVPTEFSRYQRANPICGVKLASRGIGVTTTVTLSACFRPSLSHLMQQTRVTGGFRPFSAFWVLLRGLSEEFYGILRMDIDLSWWPWLPQTSPTEDVRWLPRRQMALWSSGH